MSIRKKDYIERYGEEAYEIEKEKRRISHQKYVDSHPEVIKKHREKYATVHKEEIVERDKKRYRRPDRLKQIKESDKKRYCNKREEILKQKKEYYQAHKEEILKQNKEYLSTMTGRAQNILTSYRCDDVFYNRGECTLTKDWIVENIFNSSCVYCGESDWRKLGCDRIDNTKAHTPDNVVCACMHCNAQRAKKYTVEEFKLKKQQELNSCAKVLPPAAS